MELLAQKNQKDYQEASCFMCKRASHRDGCLECRTGRLVRDIRTELYERLGAEQNQSEWEERCLGAEAAYRRALAVVEAAAEIFNHGPVKVVTAAHTYEDAYAIAKPGMDRLFDALEKWKKP